MFYEPPSPPANLPTEIVDALNEATPEHLRDAASYAEALTEHKEREARLEEEADDTDVNSPRDYFFSRLVDNPDKDHFREGNLFHDFAEFYVSHPDAITTDTLDEVAAVILDEVDQFLRGVDREVRLTKYRVGLQTIVEFLDANPPQSDGLTTPDSGWGENFFAEYYDCPIDASHTERWFKNTDLGLKGKIDLVHTPGRLLDYKSGTKRSAYSIVKHSALDPPSDKPNFQVLLYLAHQRTERPDEELRFTFFHFLETLDDVVTGNGSLGGLPYDGDVLSRYVQRIHREARHLHRTAGRRRERL
ncbi:PD-(D/E)XK nuclease family protein [Haloquadratum walsbyi]|jgi:hypothetical protein|uniref:PD-(D/E)XK endonuclease-like domain-containing protein n=1 Tax=Haloquadratum walsbyi J07HQW2 TaxID=1238425 RepID=U1N325_9EURY|nr:PD-(D/E)XK nuclease family protein [Haloquadratum walsbyi]ERG97299.1 MAG: hypothetical protein J07HQW2_03785 [Haloquadratum walsbyi J07HQW2]